MVEIGIDLIAILEGLAPIFRDAILTGFVAGFGLFIGNRAYSWWMSPSLSIEEEDEAAGFDQRRVIVRNNGKSLAENCRGKITFENVDSTDLKRPSTLGSTTPFLERGNFTDIKEMNLDWASQTSKLGSIDINSQDLESLMVLKVGDDAILVSSGDGFATPRCYLNKPKDTDDLVYYGEILVTAGNASSESKSFKIYKEAGRVELDLI